MVHNGFEQTHLPPAYHFIPNKFPDFFEPQISHKMGIIIPDEVPDEARTL
jgi:hypothetical protein